MASSRKTFWSIFLHAILLYSASYAALRNEVDMDSLLMFKESISNDPFQVLHSWNRSNQLCEWPGVSCSKRHQRIAALNLNGYSLEGTLSPYIGNLSFLRSINLGSNRFFGEIPQQVSHLFRLQRLNLSNNMLEGKIPINLSYCARLEALDLAKNKLTGMIPLEFGSLARLELLDLNSNKLRGGIPASLGNISSLKIFSAEINNLEGNVPNELGKLKSLILFRIGSNYLSGTIPLSLYNISSLRFFSLTVNKLIGTLPSNIGVMLPNLKRFTIGGNEFSGTIPESLSNASQLEALDLAQNNFSGQVPLSLGNLKNLLFLGLSQNKIGSYSANSLDFIAHLANCSQMKVLDLTINNFGGILPNSVGNLSSNLTNFYLGGNQVSGNIPATFENLANLIILSMEQNILEGEIPTSLGKLRNLQIFSLGSNSLSGKIPSFLENLTQMFELDLSNNNLEGHIPSNLGNCRNLKHLDISKNRLKGVIPKEVFDLVSLSYILDLSRNLLTGSLPSELRKLKNIIVLDLSENILTNEIPETISECESLKILDLHGNLFQGSLPSSLASLRILEYLDLSQNNLTGQIPKDIQRLRFLAKLNISLNDLDGEVPNGGAFQNTSAISVVGNTKLCGGPPNLKLPKCLVMVAKKGNKIEVRKRLTIIIVCVVVVFLMSFAFTILFWRRKSTTKSLSEISAISFLSKVSYNTLYQATNGFSPIMLIGTGSFGSVYKALLGQDENPFAVKVLNLQRKGANKSFIAECNALRNARHRNLVKILTCCSSTDYNGNDFKALVYEYMSNGSLEKWLHHVVENQSIGLNLFQRLSIAIDVASAIYYLHEDCDEPVIHCDLKPSNVLLDNEMVARVGDFGLARLILNTSGIVTTEDQASTIGIKGTVGYAAPEYAMGGEPSKQGDVYSFGILMLEMFTGRRPTDEMFKDDYNLHNFVKVALPEGLVEIMDSALMPREMGETSMSTDDICNELARAEEGSINHENYTDPISAHQRKCLATVLEIGLSCSRESPNERMQMGDVIVELQRIRSAYISSAGGRRE